VFDGASHVSPPILVDDVVAGARGNRHDCECRLVAALGYEHCPVGDENVFHVVELAEAVLHDARHLKETDSSFDAIVLLGPLYHLVRRADRVQALGEAERVVRPGGIVLAAAISRFASLFDGLASGFLGDPVFDAIVERDLRDGQHRNPTDRVEWFTTAYFHHPDEIEVEMEDAGLRFEALFGIEGPGWLIRDLWDDPDRRQHALRAARAIEQEPTLRGLSGHLLAVARKRPSG